MRNKLVLLVVLFLFSSLAHAEPQINAGNAPYSSLANVNGTTVHSDFEIRIAAGFQIAGTYRTMNGLGTLGNGATFTVTYANGSKETFIIANKYSTVGTAPVPGTQKDANGNTIGGGGGGGGGYYWAYVGGLWSLFGPGGCIGNCGTVTVGEVQQN